MNRYDLEDIARRTAASYNLPPEVLILMLYRQKAQLD